MPSHPQCSDLCPDLAIDALIVGIETQAEYLSNKKTWTRKIVLLTNAECPIEIEDWEKTVKKMDALNISLTIVSVSFPFPGAAYVSQPAQRSGF